MRETRYWQKDNTQGGFWSKCKDQGLSAEQANDGRVLHKYTKPFPGQRWQYKTESLFGLIESCWIDNGMYGEFLKIGLQNSNGVDVLSLPVWKDKVNGRLSVDFRGFAKKVGKVSADSPITLSTLMDTKNPYSWKDPSGKDHTSIPVYILINQGGEFVSSSFEWKDGKYIGVPEVESANVGAKTYYDSTKQNDFFIDIVNKFIHESKGAFEERKNSRGMTPAEQSQEPQTVAVTASAATDDDDDLPW
jgi:hypothetical protein